MRFSNWRRNTLKSKKGLIPIKATLDAGINGSLLYDHDDRESDDFVKGKLTQSPFGQYDFRFEWGVPNGALRRGRKGEIDPTGIITHGAT